MAISNATFAAAGGAASDLFAAMGASDKGRLSADGLRLNAQGTRITAQGTRISADSLRIKARGDLAESDNYDLAEGLARENEAFTAQSTRVQQTQLDRQLTMAIGGQRAAVAAAGFSNSGSALDIMRDSANQGALARGVLGAQGAINEAGFEEQAKSYATMSAAGRATAASEFDVAGKTDAIAGQQDQIAGRQDQLARDTQDIADRDAEFGFISAAIKGISAVASLGIA